MNPTNSNGDNRIPPAAGQGANRGGQGQPAPTPQRQPGFISDIRPGSTGNGGMARPMPPNPLQPRPAQAAPQPRPAQPMAPVSRPVTSAPQPLVAPEPVTVNRPVVYDDVSLSRSQPAQPPTSPVAASQTGSSNNPSQANGTPLTLPTPAPSRKRQGLREGLSIFAVLASALLLAFCLISFVFQSYQVDGPSMQTTLHNADHLIVWKVPRTVAKITHHPYIPNRGDVIVFNETGLADASGNSGTKQLIKRVVGLPGDHVVVKDGTLTIYNKEHPDGFSPDKTLPYGNVITTTPGNVDVTLEADQVFACGDNRTNSLDSRVFGPIDADQIVGKLAVRVLPIDTFKRF